MKKNKKFKKENPFVRLLVLAIYFLGSDFY